MVSRARLLLVLGALCPASAAQIVFAPPQQLATKSADALYGSVAAGDFDGDGSADAASLDAGFVFQLVVLLGDGHGAFAPLPLQSVEPTNALLAVADMDGDGDLDLFAQGNSAPGLGLLALRGNGDGTFQPPAGLGITTSAQAVRTSDVDQDGLLDFAELSNGFGPQVALWRGTGGGTFALSQSFQAGAFLVDTLDLGQLGPDGWIDLVTSFFGQAFVFAGDGAGKFVTTPTSVIVAPSVPTQMALGDVDGDDQPDLLAMDTGSSAVDVRLGLGGTAFAPAVATPVAGGDVLTLGEFDGDGIGDVAIGAGAPPELALLRSTGGGHFVDPIPVSGHGTLGSIRALDADGDGLDDLVAYRNAPSAADDGAVLLPNATYGVQEAFLDLGGALPGTAGWPILLCEGRLRAGQPFRFTLANAEPGGQPVLIVGHSPSGGTFAGGTLWPTPERTFSLPVVGADGTSFLAGTWPAGLSGVQLWMQVWFEDAGGAQGWAATSGVLATGH